MANHAGTMKNKQLIIQEKWSNKDSAESFFSVNGKVCNLNAFGINSERC